MINGILIASLIILSLAILACLYRLIKGPSMNDRIMSLDTIGILLLSIIAVLCMLFRTSVYVDIILLIGILTFIGTTALARYIERGDVIDR
ncbi:MULTISPECIES: Na(+)/H(+) antiporter subunit F1 [Paenibacillus]|uniref:Multiple resistance and pH regulation protein F n=3 Tax=Paenibacillus TaxID=44249 RepID=G4HAP8_9BACL|nr:MULTISPECIES: Na(+)/H(+) antiporter subunit F1 [Paenibacillus]ANY75805.1 Na(+)/H(+) antiporter subunit F [Paenibacillus ihbetae]EHB67007.1 multiple resistance and pH regulation protein F [Paenibacillus lactis 154]MBP1895681.1 multicomponent Na+:H+ antiporter subunit F [Paenibacillus lactis]MCM3496815.1 Na(+)/H(+) antiporter subunit F1 [Paenibacillus lactis]GIO93637.1 putative antiporter subunit mnhF2 [Paenibacillus lactis]